MPMPREKLKLVVSYLKILAVMLVTGCDCNGGCFNGNVGNFVPFSGQYNGRVCRDSNGVIHCGTDCKACAPGCPDV